MKAVKIMALFAALALVGCETFTPHASEHNGAIFCTAGVVAEHVTDGEKSSWKIDTTAHNWWSTCQDVGNRIMDTLTGIASKTTATVGE